MGRGPGIAGQRRGLRPEGPGERQGVLSRATALSAEGEECGPLGWAPSWPQKPLTAACLPTGMFYLLSCQVCTPDLQQSLQVPYLGHRAGLVPGPLLHGVCPVGHGHPPRPDRRAVPRGKHPGPPAWGIWAGGRMLKASQLAVCHVTWGAALALSEPQAPPWPCGVAEAAGRRLHGGKMGQQRHLWGPGSRPGGSGFRCQDESQGFTPRAGGRAVSETGAGGRAEPSPRWCPPSPTGGPDCCRTLGKKPPLHRTEALAPGSLLLGVSSPHSPVHPPGSCHHPL